MSNISETKKKLISQFVSMVENQIIQVDYPLATFFIDSLDELESVILQRVEDEVIELSKQDGEDKVVVDFHEVMQALKKLKEV